MKNNNYMRREIQRLVRNGVYIELEVQKNSFAYVMFKSDKHDSPVQFIWDDEEVQYIDLQIAKEMRNFFIHKHLVITDFMVYDKKLDDYDKEVISQMTLENIYEYLNISKYYEFDEEGYPMLKDLDYYHKLLLHDSVEVLKNELNKGNKADRVAIWNMAIRLHQAEVFNDINKIKLLEKAFDKQDYFLMG